MYSNHSTPPSGDSPPPVRSVRPAPNLPAGGKAPAVPKITTALQLVEHLHGKDAAATAAYYAANLANAINLQAQLNECSGSPEQVGWKAHEAEIRSCAASLINCADVVTQLANASHAAGERHPLLNPGMLAALPPGMLARVISAGLEVEAETLLNLVETVSPEASTENPSAEGGQAS